MIEIIAFVCEHSGCNDAEAKTYFQWLLDNQIISHQLEANISGQDHLERVLHCMPEPSVKTTFNLVKNIRTATHLEKIPGAEHRLKSEDFYVNLGLNLPGSELSARYQQDILDGLHCLDLLSITSDLVGLSEFKKNFLQKFDGQTVPLLTALDPEVGVGYGNLAIEEDDINIAKNIVGGSMPENRPMPWGNIHTILFNKWKVSGNENSAIILTDDDLIEIKKESAISPNTLSVMFRLVDDKVFVENAGGACASSLIGRFTPFDGSIKNLAHDMATYEAEYNPDVIFAEIAHICHNKTANIDRREHIYSYEIPILVQSTMPVERQVLLSDLWVSVTGGKVILQSKSLGKRIVPRLSSAFNYTRNDLAVFRFLCDLQKLKSKQILALA